MSASLDNVVYQHAENACSLWWMRHLAVGEPHYSLNDLVWLDDRLEANVEALHIAGEKAEPMLEELLAADDPGALFTSALLALESGRRAPFETCLDALRQRPERYDEVSAALAWVEPDRLGTLVKELLDSDGTTEVRLGLSACASHGRVPIRSLRRHVEHPDERVRATAFRLAADTGQRALVGACQAGHGTDAEEAYEAARALALLGESDAARARLRTLAIEPSAVSRRATALLMMLCDSRAGRGFLKSIEADPTRSRDVISAFGWLGDPIAIDWLVARCASIDGARLAGAAIGMITGVDLEESGLALREPPDGFDARPNDDPDDEDVLLDEDENLPWPDAVAIARWGREPHSWCRGSLYLGGERKSVGTFERQLVHGHQWQRHAAASQLAMSAPEVPFVDVRLPSRRQRELMADIRADRG